MPFFPTQPQEMYLGYDVAFFGAPIAPIFLQYKVSSHLTRPNASEWGLFNRDYYRFNVYPDTRSPQHNRLVDLARSGEAVFYCAPMFSGFPQYANLYSTRTVADNSAFVPCGALPKITGGQPHHVIYASQSVVGYFLSGDPQPFRCTLGKEQLVSLVRREGRHFQPLAEVIPRLRRALAQEDGPGFSRGDPRTAPLGDLEVLAQTAMARFGLALGFVRQSRLEP